MDLKEVAKLIDCLDANLLEGIKSMQKLKLNNENTLNYFDKDIYPKIHTLLHYYGTQVFIVILKFYLQIL